MRITIVGGGNIGTQFAVHCAEKGHDVTVYTSSPDLYDGQLFIVDEHDRITNQATIRQATSDPEIAFGDAELILVTVPAFMMDEAASAIYEHSGADAMIGVVPGNGGSECAFRECILRGNEFFGIERVPAIARLKQKGKTVRSIGYRDELHVSAIPNRNADRFADLVGSLFDMRCRSIPYFLNFTLTPSNPILHTSRLYVIFSDWYEGVYYDKLPLFYEDWNDETSELLLSCDSEIQAICRAMPEYRLENVRSLKDHFESYSIGAMTRKISSIPAYKGLKTPSVETEHGLIPDLHSRYFTADFSFGLSIIEQVACFAGVDVPNIRGLLSWYKGIAAEQKEFRYSDYGIIDKEQFDAFYSM